MKFVSEYRDKNTVKKLRSLIAKEAKKRPSYTFIEVCGTHTMSIARFGIKKLLPKHVRLISGPGCPVCVTEDSLLYKAIDAAEKHRAILTTYADMMRVPVNGFSLSSKKAQGLDVRAIDNPMSALKIAQQNPQREVIFLGVGFETTAPLSAIALEYAKKAGVKNFSIFSSHKQVIPALELLAQDKALKIEGFLLPGHVSAIIGSDAYNFLSQKFNIASCIAGFEAIDILYAVYELIVHCNQGNSQVVNAYERIIEPQGNKKARKALSKAFESSHQEWRGLGIIPSSGLKLRKRFQDFDAEKKFGPFKKFKIKHQRCLCGHVLKGLISPKECPSFKRECTPENPLGPCMVSSEGSCAASYKYDDA